MVTIYKVDNSNITNNGKFLVEFRGLSDDDKPTSVNGGTIENGSTFIEIDTGDTYMYDLENTTWYKVESGNGGNEPMQKFDYIIPGPIYEDLSYDIADEDTIAVLEEISDNYLDGDGNVKPLLIGVNLGNDDQGVYGFGIVNTITKYHNYLNLGIYSYLDSTFLVSIHYDGTKWSVSSISFN